MVEYIYAGSVMLILFIILLVIEKKNKNISDYIFVTWLAVFLLNITTFFIVRNNIYPDNIGAKLLVEFSEASVFLHGPLFSYIQFPSPQRLLESPQKKFFILYHFWQGSLFF